MNGMAKSRSGILRRGVALATLAASLAVAGCGSLLETDYARPKLDVPQDWRSASAHQAAPDDWWREFGNPELDGLVALALERNNDLTVAVEKLRQAQLKAGLAQGDLYPSLGAQATYDRQRALSSPRKTSRSATAEATVDFDPDPWGALARTRDAADLEAEATARDLENSAQTLAGTTADLYWQLVYWRQRVALSAESIAYATHTLDLVRIRHAAGAATALDDLEAEQNLRTLEAADTQYRQSLASTENALAILFDAPPAAATATAQILPDGDLPPVAAGLPAQVLERRPDVRAAEARLHEALATTDATRASYLPSFSLTGSLGGSSVALTDVLKNPIGALGAGFTLPFLRWREMHQNIAVSESEYAAAVATFRQTLYSALADVETTLSARRYYEQQNASLRRSLDTAREVDRLYEVRYRSGAVDLQSWLDAQEKRRTAEESLLANQWNRLTNQVALYLALGGDATLPESRRVEAN